MKHFILNLNRLILNIFPFRVGVILINIFPRLAIPAGLQLFILRSKLNWNRHPKNIQKKNLNILITPIWGFAESSLAVESVLAISLKNKGMSVDFLACGGALEYCMWDSAEYLSGEISKYNKISRKYKCIKCKAAISSVSKGALNQKVISLADYSGNNNVGNNNVGINNEHSRSSALRKLLVGELSDIKTGQAVYESFSHSQKVYANLLLEVFKDKKPDRIVMTHGIYLEHGTIVDLCKKFRIPVYVYNLQYRKNTISIVKGDTYHRVLQTMDKCLWDKCLHKSKKSKLFDYIGSKISGGRDVVNYHPNPIINKNEVISRLDLNTEKPIISLFTNVLWDANIFYSSNIFEGMLDAIYHVIQYFYDDNERQLIIRVHPAESKGGFPTNLKLQSVIEERFPDLPGNIKIISPESDISSYTLAEVSDLSIVYAPNIGTELCALGHKVMVLGEAYCRGRGFTVDPDSQDQVWEFLKCVNKGMHPSDVDIEKAERFAYFWFFKLMIDFDFFDYSVLLTREMNFKSDKLNLFSESGEITNNNLREITNAIIEGRDFKFNSFNEDEV